MVDRSRIMGAGAKQCGKDLKSKTGKGRSVVPTSLPLLEAISPNVTIAVNYCYPERFVSHLPPKRIQSSTSGQADSTSFSTLETTGNRSSFRVSLEGGIDEDNNPTRPNVTISSKSNSDVFTKSTSAGNPGPMAYSCSRSSSPSKGFASRSPTASSSPVPVPQHGRSGRPRRMTKPREIVREKARVRYDMNQVPLVRRSREFLNRYENQLGNFATSVTPEAETPQKTSEVRHQVAAGGSDQGSGGAAAAPSPAEIIISSAVRPEDDKTNTRKQCTKKTGRSSFIPNPFLDGNSVIWIPQTRSEWDDSAAEMTAVCTSAAFRRHVGAALKNETLSSPSPDVAAAINKSTKNFYPPLSRDYIRDRIDIDDPLYGYQIRHRTGGWLQGFIMWTNFTTWTHYFKWDSRHPKSGVKIHSTDASGSGKKVDEDGTLSSELESQPRSGDPLSDGVVWHTMAEISLLGALGCGEYLLRMALEDIIKRGRYKFVVLQATDTSREFYERFGFVRVGAVTKYGSKEAFAANQQEQYADGAQGNKKTLGNSLQVVGYRHWTYANETADGLHRHGGPSYMMALKLPPSSAVTHEKTECRHSILQDLLEYTVEEKPTIVALGNASTPGRKKKPATVVSVKGSSQRSDIVQLPAEIKSKTPEPPVSKNVHCNSMAPDHDGRIPKRIRQAEMHTGQKRVHSDDEDTASTASVSSDSTSPSDASVECVHRNKRLKRSPAPLSEIELLKTPPPSGQTLTYAQKQYQSVWLAVPPDTYSAQTSRGRKPPRPRFEFLSPPLPAKKKLRRSPPAPLPLSLFDGSSRLTTVKIKTADEVLQRKAVLPIRATPQKKDSAQAPAAPSLIASEPKDSRPSSAPRADDARRENWARTKILRKQKVTHIPRNDPNKIYYYNKVVTPKSSYSRDESSSIPPYSFVLHYDEGKETIKIIPLVERGTFSGQRQGRTKYKADMNAIEEGATKHDIGEKSTHMIRTVPATEFNVVPSYTVTKSSVVSEESWDILV